MAVNSQGLLEAMDGIALLIDRGLIVRHIGWRNWNSFWKENGGAGEPAPVIGRNITDSFSEGEVRDTFGKLLSQVAGRKRPAVRVDYRCDSPTLRRSMRLTVSAVLDGPEPAFLLYQSTLIAVEQRPAIPLFSAPAVGSNWPNALKICCICAKVQWPPGTIAPDAEWIEPQEYYRRGGSDVVLLSHGYCRPCYEVVIAQE